MGCGVRSRRAKTSCHSGSSTPSSTPAGRCNTCKRCSTTPRSVPLTRWRNTGDGARRICRIGWGMAGFDYKQAEEIRDAFHRRQIKYLFIGKSGAILLGYPDTTQDADLFVEKNAVNSERAVAATLWVASLKRDP